MSSLEDVKGPFIVWENYGYEGWQPKSYNTLKEAVVAWKSTTEWRLTRVIEFNVTETSKIKLNL